MHTGGQQHNVAVYGDAGFLFGLFQILYRNTSSGRYMAHVQTYCFSKEKVKRHLVD